MKNTKTKTIFVHSSHVENSLTQTSKSELISENSMIGAHLSSPAGWGAVVDDLISDDKPSPPPHCPITGLSLSLSLFDFREKKILKFSLFASPIVYQVKIDQTLTLYLREKKDTVPVIWFVRDEY